MARAERYSPLRISGGAVTPDVLDRIQDRIRNQFEQHALVINDLSNGTSGDVLAGSYNYADLRLLVADVGDITQCYGRTTVKDGGEGPFICKVGTHADDDGHLLASVGFYWERIDRTFKPEQWGAKGDGVANDSAAIEKLCAAWLANNGGVLELRQSATYIVGAQDFAGAFGKGYSYRPRPVFRLDNVTGLIRVRCNGAKIKNAPGLKYGSFHPVTGAIYTPAVGGFTNPDYAAWGPQHFTFNGCTGGILIEGGLESDGQHATFTTGGYWGDVGYQLKSDFAELIDCGPYVIADVYGHHHGRDGMVSGIFGLTEADAGGTKDVPQRLVRCKFSFAGRNNLSLIGGLRFSAEDSVFDNAGQGTFASQPAAGIDIEAEGSIVRNAQFIRCESVNNAGNQMVSDSGDSANCFFSNCFFASYLLSGYVNHVSKPGFVFQRCKFIGGFAVPGPGAVYEDCTYTDDSHPTYGRWTTPVSSWAFVTSPATDFGNPPVFKRCTFSAKYSNLLFQDNYALYDRREVFEDCNFIIRCLAQVNAGGLVIKFGSDCELIRNNFWTDFSHIVSPVVTGTGSIQIGRQQNNVIHEGNIIRSGEPLQWTDASSNLGGGFSPKQRQRKGGLGEVDPRLPLLAEMRHGVGFIPDHLTSDTSTGRLIFGRNGLPTDGTWKVADRCVDLAPLSSGFAESSCFVAGTPGTWERFGRVGQTRVATFTPVTFTAFDLSVHSDLVIPGPVAVNLPAGVAVSWWGEIGDAKGDAAVNSITVTCPAGETFRESGIATIVIASNFTTVIVRKITATTWKIVSTN